MGWKASCIFINKLASNRNDFLASIPYQLENLYLPTSFEEAIMPDDEFFYLGEFKGNTIICDGDLPFGFYSEEISVFEKHLIEQFPDSIILAITLLSTVNHYGFAIIENGKKKRVKVGDCNYPTSIEIGQITEEELVFQKDSKIDEDGQRIFFDDGEWYPEDTIGEEYVFEISKRIFGYPLNRSQLDELHFETLLEKYRKT